MIGAEYSVYVLGLFAVALLVKLERRPLLDWFELLLSLYAIIFLCVMSGFYGRAAAQAALPLELDLEPWLLTTWIWLAMLSGLAIGNWVRRRYAALNEAGQRDGSH